MQKAIPEVASLAPQLILTAARYQPFPLGDRSGAAVSPVGGLASILIVLVVAVTDPSAFDAEHDRLVPVFGPLIWMAGEQFVLSAPLTDQRTTTKFPRVLPLYQPFVPAIPSIV